MKPDPTTKEIQAWLRKPTYLAISHLWDYRKSRDALTIAHHCESVSARPRKRLLAQINEWRSQLNL